ncbi:MAG TPA: Rieske 2Fe-2S domain-containing protein [Terriglobales bacterium]|nr:Rieske 2Fe-2S domain-containing protein [Terriglobales bacterium]
MAKDDCKNCPDCDKKPPKWRSDFPVSWDEDNYVTRREMVKFLALGSVLLAGANAIVAAIPYLEAATTFPETPIAGAESLAPNQSLTFRYPTEADPCIAVKDKAGKLLAYSQVCTHLSCAVVYEQAKDVLFCPCHHGYFSADAGRPIGGPPVRPLPRIKLEQRGAQIFAVGVEV